MKLPKLIDNQRHNLADILREVSKDHEHLSIATGYWDLPGTLEIIDQIKDYKSIRLLIGQEPFDSKEIKIDNIKNVFPDSDIYNDLQNINFKDLKESDKLRDTVRKLAKLLKDKKLEVKICRKPFLHAKAYIFGNFESENPIGIIGSSNFTKRGLVGIKEGGNSELNTPEVEPHVVSFSPKNNDQQHGHLSWFEEMWNLPDVEEWTGDFTKIIRNSPVGDLTFGPYDVYIKTLMEVFPDELIPKPDLGDKINDILYSFQNRNAGILVNKLNKMGMAILSDSVGLGKTITAGAVIRHYRDNGATRVVIIVPASLKAQWREDLANTFGLLEGIDFTIISQQDMTKIDEVSKLDQYKQVDLFVVDEAHNLRNANSVRHEKILTWFQNNEESKVLLLTATPINNSLNDLVNQIQLGLKGELDSITVPYYRPKSDKPEMIDFFEALDRIQKQAKKDPNFDWGSVRTTIVEGISHYLVRSTRQGVEKEGGIILKDGSKKSFPKSKVKQLNYDYDSNITNIVNNILVNNVDMIESFDSRRIDLESLSDMTQRSSHPLDFLNEVKKLNKPIIEVIPNIFQLILLLGFTPYKPETYQHKIYKKTKEEIRNLGLKGKQSQTIQLQLSIHNMLYITWLKRLESSAASLLKSAETYKNRLNSFEKWLNDGYILSFKDIDIVENEYGEDIEKAFEEYILDIDDETKDFKQRGIEKKPADPNKYNITALIKDLTRDKLIIDLTMKVLTELTRIENESKIKQFATYLKDITKNNKYGQKVLVFSFFADTITYLRDNLPKLVEIDNFDNRAEFLSGKSGSVEEIVKSFSPKSKKHKMQPGDRKIDFLFATDILSEGQNLQDAGILINYDLHWNPVRMIQRNGRINRLGSEYEEVLIANMNPESSIELYLKLVSRLQSKIKTIKQTIGTDQSILGEEANPREFIDDMKKLYGLDEKVSSATLDGFENDDNDLLSTSDAHMYELREFLNDNQESEIDRIKKIPFGKWNYLPKKTSLPNNCAIGLTRIEGKTSITGQKIVQSFFTKIILEGEYHSNVVDDPIALSYIKADKSDNARSIDTISLGRIGAARRSVAAAKAGAGGGTKKFKIEPKQEEALMRVQSSFPDDNLLFIIQNGINNSLQKKKIRKILRKINEDIKNRGSIYVSTINDFSKLIENIKTSQKEKTEIERISEILYYAKKEKHE